MAVSLGYKNVYRYPEGYPEWLQRGLPVSTIDFSSTLHSAASSRPVPVPAGLNLILVLAAVFLGGVALNLTPCIYPLIPITVSYFGASSDTVRGHKVLHGLSYIIGLALTNSALGVIAATTGGLVGSLLQNFIILPAIAALLIVFASSLLGFWEIRLPARVNALASRTYSGYAGSLFMGLTLGVIAAPCIGPFVLGLLGWIAAIGKTWFGFIVFFMLSIGMGVPLFFLAVFSSNIDRLPRSGEWMIWVKKLMGWILVGMAVYFIRPLLSEPQSITAYSAIAVGAGLHLGWLAKGTTHSAGFEKFKKVIGVCCICLAVVLVGKYITRGPGVPWVQFSDAILERAQKEKKPVIIDFYAAWCTPCRELDAITFHSPEVVEQSEKMVMIKVDLTSGATAEYEALLERFQIKGVPTILFLGADGEERRDLRLVDYLASAEFLERMKALM